MKSKIIIYWLRQDLRLTDNPALQQALDKAQAHQAKVLPIFILDEVNGGSYAQGAASRVWLHHSLDSLGQQLAGALTLFKQAPMEVFKALLKDYEVAAVCWNRCYEPWRIKRDVKIKQYLQAASIEVLSSNGSLLWEPWQIHKADGTHYKVFTPFLSAWLSVGITA